MTYVNYLISLLDKKTDEFNNEFKCNLYLTLLFLSNRNYSYDVYKKEIAIVEDYLRKVNNYKVKIQLKRKENEIDRLLSDIKDEYINNKSIIDNYNKDNLDMINILDNKDAKEITKLIDKLTKLKINKINTLNNYNEIFTNINNINKYNIDNNILTINDDVNI